MKKNILNLIESCSSSILTAKELNSTRGGEEPDNSTFSVTDEETDQNGDGTYDDCHLEVDDTAEPIVLPPIAKK